MATKKKPPAKPEPFDMVIVEWEDATAHGSVQHENPASVLSSYSPCIRRTVGYWAGQTRAVVALCTDDDRTSGVPGAIAGPMYIPASLVRRIAVVAKTTLVLK